MVNFQGKAGEAKKNNTFFGWRGSKKIIDEMEYYYKVLELSRNASIEDLKKAYREMVQVWHPDRFSSNPDLKIKAEEKMRQINEAYEIILSNKNHAQQYSKVKKRAMQRKNSRSKSSFLENVFWSSLNFSIDSKPALVIRTIIMAGLGIIGFIFILAIIASYMMRPH